MSFNGIECKFRVENRYIEIGMKYGLSIFGGDKRGPERWTPVVHARPGLAAMSKMRRKLASLAHFATANMMASKSSYGVTVSGSGIALGLSGGRR